MSSGSRCGILGIRSTKAGGSCLRAGGKPRSDRRFRFGERHELNVMLASMPCSKNLYVAGAVNAPTIALPSAALRSAAIELLGSGFGSMPLDRLVKAIDDLMRATVPGGFKIATKTFPLSAIEETWSSAGNIPRPVFLVG